MTFPRDLAHRQDVLDAVDALRLKDDGLASWAHDIVDPVERDLGRLADWAAETVDYPVET
jgi:hypothetical protein